MDKTALTHQVSNNVLLLDEELRSFVANANARLWRKCIANLYHAAYNATRALLWSKGIQTESHDGAQSMLSLHFVKSGALPKETTRHLNALMALRHAADYKGDVPIDPDEVRQQRQWVMQFVNRALARLKSGAAKVDLSSVEQAMHGAGAVEIDQAGAEAGAPPPAPRKRQRR